MLSMGLCMAGGAGLLNDAEHHYFVGELVLAAVEEMGVSLQNGSSARARMTLRFFAALVVTNVLHPSAVLALMLSFVMAASAYITAGDTRDLVWGDNESCESLHGV
jgi:hypothetical protein